MSESWEDIVGSTEKPEKKLITPPLKLEYRHESEEATALRRARSLEFIFHVMPEAKIEENGLKVVAEAAGTKFDFYPASDCYFIYSTQKYGKGIEKLCNMIQRRIGRGN